MSQPLSVGAVLTIRDFLEACVARAKEMSGVSVSKPQQRFLLLCMSSMLIHGELMLTTVCRQSLGLMSAAALSYMFSHSKIPFQALMKAAVCLLFEIYRPTKACLAIDDTDRPRCKVVKVLGFVYRTVCKVTGGYILAQNIVFVCLVTDRFTIPVAFGFYLPDPAIKKWEQEIKRLKKAKIPKKERPKKPERNADNPTRIAMCEGLLTDVAKLLKEIELHLVQTTSARFVPLKIHAVLADAAYMSPELARYVNRILGAKVNFISQLKSTQITIVPGGAENLQTYFAALPKQKSQFLIRGQNVWVEWVSALIFIKSHGRRLHVVALRYSDESQWRYLAGMDLTWRAQEIIQAYGLRWLVETFNEDWKQYGGLGKKAFQHGEEGSCRGVFLSLLLDFFFLWHPLQVRLHQSGQPLSTVGSVVARSQIEYVITRLTNF